MSGASPDPTEDVLAAELALGLIEPDERRAAEARRREDPDFDRLCATWSDRAAALLDGPEVAPNPGLWVRIAAQLPANDRAEIVVLRKSVRQWRTVAMGLGVIALALGGTLVARPHSRPLAPPTQVAAAAPIVVILTSTNRQAIVSVSFDPVSDRYTVASDAFKTGAHSAELWVIPADHVPRSLGLVPLAKNVGQIAPPEGASRIAPGATLAISLEPFGGSRTGKPTGPVVLSGQV